MDYWRTRTNEKGGNSGDDHLFRMTTVSTFPTSLLSLAFIQNLSFTLPFSQPLFLSPFPQSLLSLHVSLLSLSLHIHPALSLPHSLSGSFTCPLPLFSCYLFTTSFIFHSLPCTAQNYTVYTSFHCSLCSPLLSALSLSSLHKAHLILFSPPLLVLQTCVQKKYKNRDHDVVQRKESYL